MVFIQRSISIRNGHLGIQVHGLLFAAGLYLEVVFQADLTVFHRCLQPYCTAPGISVSLLPVFACGLPVDQGLLDKALAFLQDQVDVPRLRLQGLDGTADHYTGHVARPLTDPADACLAHRAHAWKR